MLFSFCFIQTKFERNLFMQKVFCKIISLVLVLIIVINSSICLTEAFGASSNSFPLVLGQYSETKTISKIDTTFTLTIESVDLKRGVFTGRFSVSGAYNINAETTKSSFSTDAILGSDGPSIYGVAFYAGSASVVLDLNDETGIMSGLASIGIRLITLNLVGSRYSIESSSDISSIQYSAYLFRETKKYSVDIYDKKRSYYTSATAPSNSFYSSPNTRSMLPTDILNDLVYNGYQDIEGYNFNNDKDDDVSFVIAHKKTDDYAIGEDGLIIKESENNTGGGSSEGDIVNEIKNQYKDVYTDECVLIIRGTDGVEWEGNMKICPPDENGNTDVYTFDDNDSKCDRTHANFLSAEKYVEQELIDYIQRNDLNYKTTLMVLSGHSRGAAVSNLLAKYLTDDNYQSNPHFYDNKKFEPIVTCYTYATPSVAPYTATMENYTNIYNYCRNNDFIPNIPLVNYDWKYWKYGKTFIENGSDDVYCNDITDLMASNQNAPNVKEYYNKKFRSKYDEMQNISLYNYMINVIGKIMGSPSGFSNKINPFLSALGTILSYNELTGMSLLVALCADTIKENHKPEGYYQLSKDSYHSYTFADALSRCSTGATPRDISTISSYALNAIENGEDSPNSLIEISQLSAFAQNDDDFGVSNSEKLGWDINDTSTWDGIIFDENGYAVSIDLNNKDLYGTLNLSNFSHLEAIDVSTNFITNINFTNCSALCEIDISNNNISSLNLSDLLSLASLNCSSNNLSSINLIDNINLKYLDCFDCHLSDLDLSTLVNLESLNCGLNNLTTLNISNNTNMKELYCLLNYLDLSDDDLISSFDAISEDKDCIVYIPQYIPENSQFDFNELASLRAFANTDNNNSILNFIDSNNELSIKDLQCFVEFEKINEVYHIVNINISNYDLSGALQLDNFTYLKELYCNDTNISSLNLSGCSSLEKLYCDNSNISDFVLPSDYSCLTELSCVNNHIDINIFNNQIVSSIISKENYTLDYRHQILTNEVNAFDEIDYTALIQLAEESNNADILGWDLSKPGEWGHVNWKYDSISNKYKLVDCIFDCFDISGNIDLSMCQNLEEISFLGTDIRTIILPSVNIGNNDFYDCKYLESIIISDDSSSINIGENSFKYCKSLQAAYIPSNITTIADSSFYGCNRLTIAGESESYAENYCAQNSIPFIAGYFLCGNVVSKEDNVDTYEYYYPVEQINVLKGTQSYISDEYGYFVVFGLSSGNYSFNLTYKYGYDLILNTFINNSCMIVTTPIGIISCDFYKDGHINAKDFSYFKKAQVNSNLDDYKLYDINKDGIVDEKDWDIAKSFFLIKDNSEIVEIYNQTSYDVVQASLMVSDNERNDTDNNDYISNVGGIEVLIGEDFD